MPDSLDTYLARWEAEIGAYPVGADSDEYGAASGVGGGQDEFGASSASMGIPQNRLTQAKRAPISTLTWQNLAKSLANAASAGRVRKEQLLKLAALVHPPTDAKAGYPAYGKPFPGYGGPTGPGKGSTAVPIGIGSTLSSNNVAMVITRANPRGPMRIRRVLIQASGTNSSNACPGLVKGIVTAMTVAGFPLIDGNMGTSVFDIANQSPPEFNQVWEPGIPFSVSITLQGGLGVASTTVNPHSQTYSVAVICSAM